MLGGGGSVEHHRVESALTVDGVAAVARVPDERIGATAEQRDILAAAPGDDVVAAAADQQVVAVAADEGVVARSTIHGDQLVGEAVADPDGVVATSTGDDDLGELGAVEVLHVVPVGGHRRMFGSAVLRVRSTV